MTRLTDVQLQAYFARARSLPARRTATDSFTISKSGTAAWELRYRCGGNQRWLTLGRYPDVSLKEARIRALKERGRVADGIDVVATGGAPGSPWRAPRPSRTSARTTTCREPRQR
jgi:hypothetical protein